MRWSRTSQRLEIDGAPFPEARARVIGEPCAAQLDWVRSTAIPLSRPDAGNGFDDLEGVRDIVGDARLVALGEATHGTSEFFRTKHRLLEFLATRMGFTIFAIEANMPEAYRLNEYVLTGRGDPKKLLAGMYFWTRNTQEVLDMILWMRQFNASGMGRIQFTGFDMQTGYDRHADCARLRVAGRAGLSSLGRCRDGGPYGDPMIATHCRSSNLCPRTPRTADRVYIPALRLIINHFDFLDGGKVFGDAILYGLNKYQDLKILVPAG